MQGKNILSQNHKPTIGTEIRIHIRSLIDPIRFLFNSDTIQIAVSIFGLHDRGHWFFDCILNFAFWFQVQIKFTKSLMFVKNRCFFFKCVNNNNKKIWKTSCEFKKTKRRRKYKNVSLLNYKKKVILTNQKEAKSLKKCDKKWKWFEEPKFWNQVFSGKLFWIILLLFLKNRFNEILFFFLILCAVLTYRKNCWNFLFNLRAQIRFYLSVAQVSHFFEQLIKGCLLFLGECITF